MASPRPLRNPAPPPAPPLQALHIEGNFISELPVGPYLGSLQELLLDWHTALASTAALRAATQLSRLVLHPWSQDATAAPPDAAAGEALLEALASMPALQLVEEVLPPTSSSAVCAGQAAVMWQLGRRCPHLRLGVREDSYVGWTLCCLIAEMPQSAGMRLVQ